MILRVEVQEDGSLLLVSQGKKFGDPGFYFLLMDAKGQHHAKYIPSFHESLHVYVDHEDVLRTDHVLNMWRCKALHLHYKMMPGRSD